MNFPTNPSAGDLFTINNITYKYNNPGWEIHGTTADTITTDCGVIPFAGQSAAPAAIPRQTFTDTSGIELLLHFDDNLNDSSLNGHTVTGSNLQGYSASMSGFGKKLRLTKTSASYFHFPDPGIGTSDYTIEFWFHPVSQQTMALLNDGQATYGDWNIQFNYTSGVHSIAFWDSIGGGSFITYTADLSGNGWYLGDLKHLAIVREDAGSSTSNIRIYFNGNYVPPNGASSSFPAATRSIGNSSTNWKFGTYPNASYYADGHVDDLRITKEALYFGTGVYNVPTAPFSDPTIPAAISGKAQLYGKSVVAAGTPAGDICLHFDNNYTDAGSTGATVTAPGTYNSPTFDSSVKKFGTHSIYFDPDTANSGGDDFVVIPYSVETKFDADFTVDFWIKLHPDADNALFSDILNADRAGSGSSYVSTFKVAYYGASGGGSYPRGMYFALPDAGNGTHNWAITHPLSTTLGIDIFGAFVHVAVVRNSGTSKIYLNGSEVTGFSTYSGFFGSSGTVNLQQEDYLLGRRMESGDTYNTRTRNYAMKGWIDEFRMVKGSALHTSNFTPPTVAHGAGPITTKIYAMNSAGVESPLT